MHFPWLLILSLNSLWGFLKNKGQILSQVNFIDLEEFESRSPESKSNILPSNHATNKHLWELLANIFSLQHLNFNLQSANKHQRILHQRSQLTLIKETLEINTMLEFKGVCGADITYGERTQCSEIRKKLSDITSTGIRFGWMLQSQCQKHTWKDFISCTSIPFPPSTGQFSVLHYFITLHNYYPSTSLETQ